MQPGYWSLAFASGAYEFFSPLNYFEALSEAIRDAKLSQGEHVLDAGSGMGSLIPLCQPWLKQGGKLVCMDIDSKGLSGTLKRAESLGVAQSVEVREADFTQASNFRSTEFDVILSLFSLYTISDESGRLRTLQNFYSALKNDGRMILEVPSMDYNANSILNDARNRFETTIFQKLRSELRNFFLLKWLIKLQKNLENGVFHKFKEDEVIQLLLKVGFRDVLVRKIYGGNALMVSCR